ncbi:hypothetical protein E5672_10185 [Alteromonas portus]|uniref:Uncharacterized protein n=1 Tax=Alteromonas portus TaxID=2565549 RepID=A0A4U0ZC46_9ALTE|nr:hypothetical protein [Alteromonas portus]TKB03399.1 hypothetical protein E5672_10185 [Alteromonas portus]
MNNSSTNIAQQYDNYIAIYGMLTKLTLNLQNDWVTKGVFCLAYPNCHFHLIEFLFISRNKNERDNHPNNRLAKERSESLVLAAMREKGTFVVDAPEVLSLSTFIEQLYEQAQSNGYPPCFKPCSYFY